MQLTSPKQHGTLLQDSTAIELEQARERVRQICFAVFNQRVGRGGEVLYYHPLLWRMIFVRVFRQAPQGDDDPRWDELLWRPEGYRALTAIRLHREAQ